MKKRYLLLAAVGAALGAVGLTYWNAHLLMRLAGL